MEGPSCHVKLGGRRPHCPLVPAPMIIYILPRYVTFGQGKEGYCLIIITVITFRAVGIELHWLPTVRNHKKTIRNHKRTTVNTIRPLEIIMVI